MIKIATFLILIILSLGFLYWWKNPKILSKKPYLQPVSNILGETVDFKPKALLDDAQDSLHKISQDATNELVEGTKQSIYNNAQSVLAEVFNQTDANIKNGVSVVINPTTTSDNAILIDFSADNNLQLKISKNSKYQLKFKNTPPNFCLYIGENKYEISNDKTVELQFTKDGNYLIKANLCDLNDRAIGRVTVE